MKLVDSIFGLLKITMFPHQIFFLPEIVAHLFPGGGLSG